MFIDPLFILELQGGFDKGNIKQTCVNCSHCFELTPIYYVEDIDF
jgi:hypothetical protein